VGLLPRGCGSRAGAAAHAISGAGPCDVAGLRKVREQASGAQSDIWAAAYVISGALATWLGCDNVVYLGPLRRDIWAAQGSTMRG
jgi:hypothetical protein